MKNKLCAKIRSYFYTIWILTEKTSSKNNLCVEICSYILYLLSSHLLLCFLALDTQIEVCLGFNILSCNTFIFYIYSL